MQITLAEAREGDIIRIVKECNDGTSCVYVGKVEYLMGARLGISCCGVSFSATSVHTGNTVTRIYLVKRPPIQSKRRPIAIDELKTLPIGTHIEFECADTGRIVSGKLVARTETNSWSITVSGHACCYLSSIKPGTLTV